MKIETFKQESWTPRSITITFETREELNAFAARMNATPKATKQENLSPEFGGWEYDSDKSYEIYNSLLELK